jgi:tetratricopeptide (TPR) repeat protein
MMAGQEGEAEQAYSDALTWFEQDEDNYTDRNAKREALACAAHGLGLARWRQEKRVEAQAALKYAVELLGERHCAKTIEVLTDLSVLQTVFLGKLEEGLTYARQALLLTQEIGDTDLEAFARRRITASLVSVRGTELASVSETVKQTQLQLEANNDLVEAAEYSLRLATVSYWMAKIASSRIANAQRVALAEQCRQFYHLWTSHTWQALLFASQGLWKEAECEIEKAHCQVDSLTNPVPTAFLHQICGFLAYQCENYELAERQLQLAQLDQNLQDGLGDFMFYPGLIGLVQATMGKQEEAREYITKVEANLAKISKGILPTAPLMVCLALIALTLGDKERAIRLYTPLLAFEGQHYWFLVDRVLGQLALC